MTPDHLETLRQRRDYLTERIAAKQRVGWESEYDARERDALAWAVETLSQGKSHGDNHSEAVNPQQLGSGLCHPI